MKHLSGAVLCLIMMFALGIVEAQDEESSVVVCEGLEDAEEQTGYANDTMFFLGDLPMFGGFSVNVEEDVEVVGEPTFDLEDDEVVVESCQLAEGEEMVTLSFEEEQYVLVVSPEVTLYVVGYELILPEFPVHNWIVLYRLSGDEVQMQLSDYEAAVTVTTFSLPEDFEGSFNADYIEMVREETMESQMVDGNSGFISLIVVDIAEESFSMADYFDGQWTPTIVTNQQ
jgi:hypothetical protein